MRWLARLRYRVETSEANDPLLTEALKRAAARVEPRIKQSRGWPGRFHRPIAVALAQARQVAQAIPGPIELDASHFSGDRFVHALFSSADTMSRLLCSSEVMREYAADGPHNEAYALLSLRREEKQTYGMEEHGSILRRDVPQRVVWFADHRLIGPAPTLPGARENATWALFERFLARLIVGLERLRTEKARLAREKDSVLARLRGANRTTRAELQRTLKAVLKQLNEATESLEPDQLHEVFETVLSHPEDCLYLEERTLNLDAMGVVRAKPEGPDVATLKFTELMERYHEPRTLVFAHCGDFRPVGQEERFEEAGRWLA